MGKADVAVRQWLSDKGRFEAQDKIHYAMPVRNMVYDSLDYAEQVRIVQKGHKGRYATSEEFLSGFGKEDKIYPVITLVFYDVGGKSPQL
ncbi:hypothetical protein H6B07_04535 [Mediterraneibacter glycyrrhizinilyticus]|uniref:hypothetical protein n=1 Tax=Mediterraneibacter glycyrrhizinilyticus TaxID=342942 RepID=UPI00195FB8C7|nr:hypothetical protein [Mediterraneibacter glycyrrhizinilyticus]MBM6801946.1 hypothetical protein [Mediterraneibacter glycyrrhizinilyticus]MDM8124633.1 hypothetical protein [Mediterraneibacter glycyrrhizinilyticus]